MATSDTLTSEEIQAELALVRSRRAKILAQNIVSESMQGRQTVWEGQSALDALDRHEDRLLRQLARLTRSGIALRTGVPAH